MHWSFRCVALLWVALLRMLMVAAALMTVTVTTSGQESGQKRAPIIDVQRHAQQVWTSPRADVGGRFGSVFAEPITGILAAECTANHQRATLAALERYNIVNPRGVVWCSRVEPRIGWRLRSHGVHRCPEIS